MACMTASSRASPWGRGGKGHTGGARVRVSSEIIGQGGRRARGRQGWGKGVGMGKEEGRGMEGW